MSKTQLIAHLAAKLGVSKRVAGEMINTFVDAVVTSVKKGDEVESKGSVLSKNLLEKQELV